MTLLALALLLALVAAAWVVHPLLFRRWGLIGDVVPAALSDRETRKRVALAALKDVEYDHAAGKLDDADYREIRGRLEMEALHALSEDGPSGGTAPETTAAAPPLSAAHACGFTNPEGSRFCAGCGQRLT